MRSNHADLRLQVEDEDIRRALDEEKGAPLPPPGERRRLRVEVWRGSLAKLGRAVGTSDVSIFEYEKGREPREPIRSRYAAALRLIAESEGTSGV